MKAKLIYKSNMTYLPTSLPVQYFGLPDGKVYVIYARFYTTKLKRTEVEYVFGIHEEFSFDYQKFKIYDLSDTSRSVYSEMVDKVNPKIKILKVYQSIKSFAEATSLLNKRSESIYKKLNKGNDKRIQLLPNIAINSQTATA